MGCGLSLPPFLSSAGLPRGSRPSTAPHGLWPLSCGWHLGGFPRFVWTFVSIYEAPQASLLQGADEEVRLLPWWV